MPEVRGRNTPTDTDAMVRWLFDNSREILFVIGPDKCFKLVSPAWSRSTGWSEAEIIGRPAREIIHPDDQPEIDAHIARMETDGVGDNTSRILMKDGGWRWFAGRAQFTEDGHIIGIVHDVTDERARRLELEAARKTQLLLAESAGVGAWAYEPAENRVIWSEDIHAVTGYSQAEISTPEAFAATLHPEEAEAVGVLFVRGVESGQAQSFEHRMRHKDGAWTSWRATFHCEPRPGGVFALRGISQNITELAAARDAAQTNARRLKVALNAADAGVYEIDHVNKTFWSSPEFEKLIGHASCDYEEARRLEFPKFHPDDLGKVRQAFRDINHGKTISGEAFEARVITPRGDRWVRVFHHLAKDANGRWLKGVGLVHDFDAHKRQELALIEAERAAQAAAEAKAAFLANMSHEIRTPMNGVMGVLHLLKTEALSRDGRAMLEEALSCGQMLAELLNDVIDFSKIEAGRLELSSEAVDPEALVQGVVSLLRPQAQAKSLEMRLEGFEAIGWVRTDPVRLRQALFNLVGNAVKFTLQGQVVVRAALAGGPADQRLRLEIEDTGVGIPAEAQARIFQRFDQGDASTTRRFGGSGLGLAITQRLAEMMGGELGFHSVEGQGSTFWLEVAAPEADAIAPETAPAADVLAGLRILVVEDNSTNRMIATKLLENLGARVETAADGLLGVEAAARGAFDLILMDVQMPGIDGLEASRRVRALGGPVAATPIVALTANVLSHQRQAYLEAGMDGVVAKPISPSALLAEIARLSEPRDDEAAA